MSMTTSEPEEIEGELIEAPATISARRENCSLDDAYIFNYTNNPKAGKTAALRAAGYDGQNIRQEAYRMHGRLRPRINQVLREVLKDLGNLSHQQLTGILMETPDKVGYANMLNAIKTGLEYSGNKPVEADTKEIKQSQDAIAKRISTLQSQIAAIEGPSTSQ